jgi:hypothetical protein
MTFLAPEIIKLIKRQQHFLMILYELMPLGEGYVLVMKIF